MPYDIVIVGGGPAGLSAAVNAAARGKTCAVLTNDRRLNPLFRARVVDNYLGMRGLSGGEMLDRMHAEAEEAGAVFLSGRVVSVLPFEDKFLVGLGDTLVEGKRVILATGAMAGTPLPGEAALVGQGVSYCATCDGMLYRSKTAVVTGNAADLREEANFLQGIGVRVTVITRQELDGLDPGIGHRTARSMAIQGDGRLEGFVARRGADSLRRGVRSAGGHGPGRTGARPGAGRSVRQGEPPPGDQYPWPVRCGRLHGQAAADCPRRWARDS